MNIIVGYEKAWGAFLGAGSIGAATTLALSLFAAIGAYLPTNTEAKPAAEEMPLPPPLR
jgi:hypothetical protein